MTDLVPLALAVTAFIIVIGFLANYLFVRKGLPDMLILIFLGVLFGPVLGIFDPSAVQAFAPYFAALAVVFILFDGGIGLSIRRVLSHSPRAVLLASLGFIFSSLIVSIFMVVVFNVPLLYGFLFGSIFGGSSSIVVISLASRIRISEKAATTLILESAITDILCIVISLAIIGVIATGETDLAVIGITIADKFLIGAAVGIFLGIAWLFMLRKVSSLPFSYILNLGIILFAYAASEVLGGSGALSSLLFGLILGNEKEISAVFTLKDKKSKNQSEKAPLAVSKGLKRFEAEIAFLIRTFFFVFLGIIATISSLSFLLYGVLLSILLLAVRYVAVWLSTIKCEIRKETGIMTAVLTRGLAAAVLATLPAQYGLLYADLFVNLAVVIVVSTAIIATVGVLAVPRKNGKPLPPKQRPPTVAPEPKSE